MPVFPPEADLLPQVMQIAAGAVDNLPEHPQLNHMENRHFLPPVTAVFQQHAGNAGFLRQANQLEAFKQAGGAAHLQADGNPAFRAARVTGIWAVQSQATTTPSRPPAASISR